MQWRVGVILVVGGFVASGCASGAAVAVASAPTESTTTTATPAATLEPPETVPITVATETVRQPIVLGFAGDTAFTDGLHQRDPFGRVIDLVQAPDLMVVNLETAVADPGVGRPPVDKEFLFRSPPQSLDLLVAAGVDVVTLANNHTLDFGPDALAQTLVEIDSRGLARVGAGLDEAEAYEPLLIQVGDWTVGLVSLSRVPCDWSATGENTRPQVAWACPSLLALAEESARRAVDRADVTVVMIHGGEEGVLCPSPWMVELEQLFAEIGVDAVVNGHPHVLQGLTRTADTWIAHSLGNFAFPSSQGITGNSAIVQLHVAEDGLGMSIVPIRSDGGVLTEPTNEQRLDILDQVERYSQGVAVDANGTVTADPTRTGDC